MKTMFSNFDDILDLPSHAFKSQNYIHTIKKLNYPKNR